MDGVLFTWTVLVVPPLYIIWSIKEQTTSWVSHLLTTTPCLRELRDTEYSSSDEQHELPSSLYPHRDPPQSSLTLSPPRVMPYRSHVQQPSSELGLLLRELADDGESLSERLERLEPTDDGGELERP